MDIIVNGNKITTLEIVPTTTIREFKSSFRNWLKNQGYDKYDIQVVFNDGNQLSQIVLDSDTYDKNTFESHGDKLHGGKIIITVPEVVREINNTKYVYVYYDHDNAEALFASFTKEGALKQWMEYLGNEDDLKSMLDVDELDLSDPETQDFLIENMSDNRSYLYTVPLV